MDLIPTKRIVSSRQKKLEFTYQPIPVSVAVYQSITTDEYAAKWLVEKDTKGLLDKFVDCLMNLSSKKYLSPATKLFDLSRTN